MFGKSAYEAIFYTYRSSYNVLWHVRSSQTFSNSDSVYTFTTLSLQFSRDNDNDDEKSLPSFRMHCFVVGYDFREYHDSSMTLTESLNFLFAFLRTKTIT